MRNCPLLHSPRQSCQIFYILFYPHQNYLNSVCVRLLCCQLSKIETRALQALETGGEPNTTTVMTEDRGVRLVWPYGHSCKSPLQERYKEGTAVTCIQYTTSPPFRPLTLPDPTPCPPPPLFHFVFSNPPPSSSSPGCTSAQLHYQQHPTPHHHTTAQGMPNDLFLRIHL